MNLINTADLIFKTDAELVALIQEAMESLQHMHVGCDEYNATIGSIQVLRYALAARRMHGPKF